VRQSLAILAFLLAGCSLLAPPESGQFPEDCARLGFSEVKCRLIVSRAATQAGIEPLEVSSARFVSRVPEPGVQLGGTRIAVVALTLAGGEERVEEVWCTGISNDGDRICHHDPHIRMSQGIDTDVPCPGEPPDGCATPPPTPRPASVKAAVSLDLPSLDISLDRVGSYEIEVGEAGLPDGTLSERRATLRDARPTTFWIDDGIRLEVRPTEAGRPPIGSMYRDPYDGVEPVRVFLVFDVVETSPGAVLQVRDILVR
jgi:hypothetical protein